uniref:Uncharacterized protein n=1 Tax=Leersia perrieri TaxID=77586 RepID=A0A0D9W459_9ORYZ
MGIKAAMACLLLLLAVAAAAPGGALQPAAPLSTSGAWVEDAAVEVLQAAPLMMLGEVVHRRVLQAQGGYINPSLVASQQWCNGGCSQQGQPYTGRGNQCIYHNQSC